MTFSVGTTTFTVYDDDENDALPGLGQIAVGQLDLADGIVYRLVGAYAQAVYSPDGGLDGPKFSILSNVNSIANRASPPETALQSADNNNGKTVSVYAHYSGFASFINEPARAQANVKVVAPPPLESEGVETETLKSACPRTSCSALFPFPFFGLLQEWQLLLIVLVFCGFLNC